MSEIHTRSFLIFKIVNHFLRTLIRTKANVDTEIKIEKDFVGGYEFEGTVFSESNSSDLIDRMKQVKYLTTVQINYC